MPYTITAELLGYVLHNYSWTTWLCPAQLQLNYLALSCTNTAELLGYAIYNYSWITWLCHIQLQLNYLAIPYKTTAELLGYAMYNYSWTTWLCPVQLQLNYLAMSCTTTAELLGYVLHNYSYSAVWQLAPTNNISTFLRSLFVVRSSIFSKAISLSHLQVLFFHKSVPISAFLAN
jgi:hypothetical protein